jgi:hypothetical protein
MEESVNKVPKGAPWGAPGIKRPFTWKPVSRKEVNKVALSLLGLFLIIYVTFIFGITCILHLFN